MEKRDIIFCDTSSLARIFYTDENRGFFSNFYYKEKPQIVIAEWTKLEFITVVQKKLRQRIGEINREKISRSAKKILIEQEKENSRQILIDYYFQLPTFFVLETDNEIIKSAYSLVVNYNHEYGSLYAPDAVQLATAIHHKNSCDAFSAVDQSLLDFFKLHNLPIF